MLSASREREREREVKPLVRLKRRARVMETTRRGSEVTRVLSLALASQAGKTRTGSTSTRAATTAAAEADQRPGTRVQSHFACHTANV